MIKIDIVSGSAKKLIHSLELKGHAGYADSGYDIVCAAVSSQVISVENSLQQLLSIPVQSDVKELEGGYLKLQVPQTGHRETDQQGQLLLRHLCLSLEVLAENYPEFISIKYTYQ